MREKNFTLRHALNPNLFICKGCKGSGKFYVNKCIPCKGRGYRLKQKWVAPKPKPAPVSAEELATMIDQFQNRKN